MWGVLKPPAGWARGGFPGTLPHPQNRKKPAWGAAGARPAPHPPSTLGTLGGVVGSVSGRFSASFLGQLALGVLQGRPARVQPGKGRRAGGSWPRAHVSQDEASHDGDVGVWVLPNVRSVPNPALETFSCEWEMPVHGHSQRTVTRATKWGSLPSHQQRTQPAVRVQTGRPLMQPSPDHPWVLCPGTSPGPGPPRQR